MRSKTKYCTWKKVSRYKLLLKMKIILKLFPISHRVFCICPCNTVDHAELNKLENNDVEIKKRGGSRNCLNFLIIWRGKIQRMEKDMCGINQTQHFKAGLCYFFLFQEIFLDFLIWIFLFSWHDNTRVTHFLWLW